MSGLTVELDIRNMDAFNELTLLLKRAHSLYEKIGSSTFSGNMEFYLVSPKYIHDLDQWVRDVTDYLERMKNTE